jgi:hypothetical protein
LSLFSAPLAIQSFSCGLLADSSSSASFKAVDEWF